MPAIFPFSAIVGQDEMKLALLIAAIDQSVGGVLVFGDRGTGKSTTVRALAALLPPMPVVAGCRFNCAPGTGCTHTPDAETAASAPVPVVDLPLGATEDRVVGALDWNAPSSTARKPSSRACSPAPTAASSTSTK